ncbi:hypothetical protein D3C73_1154030 [compost metagenome]
MRACRTKFGAAASPYNRCGAQVAMPVPSSINRSYSITSSQGRAASSATSIRCTNAWVPTATTVHCPASRRIAPTPCKRSVKSSAREPTSHSTSRVGSRRRNSGPASTGGSD